MWDHINKPHLLHSKFWILLQKTLCDPFKLIDYIITCSMLGCFSCDIDKYYQFLMTVFIIHQSRHVNSGNYFHSLLSRILIDLFEIVKVWYSFYRWIKTLGETNQEQLSDLYRACFMAELSSRVDISIRDNHIHSFTTKGFVTSSTSANNLYR